MVSPSSSSGNQYSPSTPQSSSAGYANSRNNSPYSSFPYTNTIKTPRKNRRYNKIPPPSPTVNKPPSPPLPPATTSKKIAAFLAGFFVGLGSAVISGCIGLLITAIVSIPLVVEENQSGYKFVAQKVVQTVITGIGSFSSLLFGIRTGWNVGKSIRDSIIRG